MYFHGVSDVEEIGQPQVTMAALSRDGLSFTDGVCPIFLGGSYFRVFHVRDQAYAFANGCRLWKAPPGASGVDDAAWTPPGRFPHPGFLWKEIPLHERVEREWAPRLQIGNGTIRHCSLLRLGKGRFHLFYTVKGADPPERILMTDVDASAPDWRAWTFSEAEEVLRPELPWEGGDLPLETSRPGIGHGRQLRDPFVFEDDGRIYLYYAGRGEGAIGLVELTALTVGDNR
jgi:hypothetical protein